MATTLGLLVKLGLDPKGFHQGLGAASKSVASFGSTLLKIGGAVGGILAVGKAVDFATSTIKDSIGAASNLSETTNKINVVFGDAAAAIFDFSKTAGTALGQSQQAALDAASTFGVFGKMAGLTGKGLSSFSTDLVGLASDMASFHNTSPEEAIIAISAALRGESEPIRRYGVLLDDATLKNKALQMGIIKTTKNALTPQQKVLAAQAVIMEQTIDAQGDFARTSRGLANSQRILKAQWQDTKTLLGQAFLPLMETGTRIISEKFMPAVKGIIDKFLIPAIPAVTRFAEKFGALIGAIAEGGKFSAKGIVAYLFDGKAPQFLKDAAGALDTLIPWLQTALPAAIAWLSNAWTNVLLPALQTVWAWVLSDLIPAISDLWAWLQINVPLAVAWLANAWTTVLLPAIQAVVGYWNGTLLPAIQAVVGWITGTFIPALQAIWSFIAPVLLPLFNLWAKGLAVDIPAAISVLVTFFNTVLLPAVQAVWSWISTNLIPLFLAVGEVISAVVGVEVTILAGIWQNVLLPALQAVWDFISPILIPLLGTAGEAVSGLSGLVGSLAGAFGDVTKAIQDVIGWLGNLAKDISNINLPWWMTPGSPTPWEIGLRGVGSAMQALTDTALPQFEAALDMQVGGLPGLAAGGGGAREVHNTYNIFAKENPGQVQNALSLSALMGGAA